MPELYTQTEAIETCRVCDAGKDPLDVPHEPCGHDRDTHRKVTHIVLVLKRDYDAVVKAGNELATAAAWPEDQHGISSAIRKWRQATDGS